MYPITRFNSWQMQLCVIAGPVSCPRKCVSRSGRTERDERDESSSFFFLFLSFSSPLLPFCARASLISFPFSFFIFSRFFSGRFGRFLGFGLHTGLQQRAVKRRNFCLAGARVVGESVSLESIENCERICRWIFFFFFFWEDVKFVSEERVNRISIFLNFWKCFSRCYGSTLNRVDNCTISNG